MAQRHHSARSSAGKLGPHLRGHALRFEAKPPLTYDSATGLRLLLIVLFLEGVLGSRLSFLPVLGLPLPPFWARVPIVLGLVLLLVRFFGRVTWADLGLRRWRDWSFTEKSYFIQVILLANGVFAMLFAERLRTILAAPSSWGPAAVVFPSYWMWGFYQELVYRGLLQTELVRRWGVLAGILVSNALYTFGPLHFYHFSGGPPSRVLAMFAGIFAIGLYFALVYRRSGNLWMVGIFHGLGDAYITGLGALAT